MLARTEGPDISALSKQFQELVSALLEAVGIPGSPMDVEANEEGCFRGYDDKHFYQVLSGTVAVRYQQKTLYKLEAGDLLLPDIAGTLAKDVAVQYVAEGDVSLLTYSGLDFMQRVFDDPMAMRLWTRLLVAYSGLMLRLTAASTLEDAPVTPGFEVYQSGDTIIRQGDRANYVFNMTAGIAEVLVDDVPVGRIADGEIFGAMAALTQMDRSATVRAKTVCSVVKVPKDQFSELIKSNPATIQSLMVDMAHSIVNLNEQLVASQGEKQFHQSGDSRAAEG
ncbi:MAG: cyclic nucleotide-binding domain-containing protein [Halioglobus sp.]